MEKLKMFRIRELEWLISGAADNQSDAFWTISGFYLMLNCSFL